MKRPVAAIAAPPRATVQAAAAVRSKERGRVAAEVGEDPEAAVKVPLWEAAGADPPDAEEAIEDRTLVDMEEAAEEEEAELRRREDGMSLTLVLDRARDDGEAYEAEVS